MAVDRLGMASGLSMLFVLWVSTAAAQAPHPRRARSMALDHDRPAVLLEDDVAWQPDQVAVSVCSGMRCAAVATREVCQPPACPGYGYRMELDADIGDVSSWPTTRDGFEEEVEAMRYDPELQALSGYFGAHPERDDDGDDSEGLFFHVSVLGSAGTLGGGGGALVGATGSIGMSLFARGEDRYGSSSTKLWETFFFGDRNRLVVRGDYLTNLSQQGTGDVALVGAALELENRVEGTAWGVPTLLSLLLPEMGASFRQDASPGFYARWNMPVRLYFSSSAGAEIRLSAGAIERVDDEGIEGLVTLSLGAFVR